MNLAFDSTNALPPIIAVAPFALFVISVVTYFIYKRIIKRHVWRNWIFNLQIAPKKMLSFRSSKWGFKDYPVEVRKIISDDPKICYAARILNWPSMIQPGATPKEARQNLADKFEKYATENQKLPRPGSKVPLKISSTAQVDRYLDVFESFSENVLSNYLRTPLFISDKSYLSYFCAPDDSQQERFKKDIIRRTRDAFGVDITNYYDEPLYKVLAYIKAHTDAAIWRTYAWNGRHRNESIRIEP